MQKVYYRVIFLMSLHVYAVENSWLQCGDEELEIIVGKDFVRHDREFLEKDSGGRGVLAQLRKKIAEAETDVVKVAENVRGSFAQFVLDRCRSFAIQRYQDEVENYNTARKESCSLNTCYFETRKEYNDFLASQGANFPQRWLRIVEKLDTWVGNWLSGMSPNIQAFLRISLYLWFGDELLVNMKSVIKDGILTFPADLQYLVRWYMVHGDRCVFAFGDEMRASMLERIVAFEQDKVLVVLPNTWDNIDYCAAALDSTGFFMPFVDEIKNVSLEHENALIMDAAHHNIHRDLASGFLNKIAKQWESDALKVAIVGYQYLYRSVWCSNSEKASAFLDDTRPLTTLKSLRDIFASYIRGRQYSFPNDVAEMQKQIFGAGMYLQLEAFSEGGASLQDYDQFCNDVMCDIAKDIKGFDMIKRQQETVKQLKESWQEVNGHLKSVDLYQRVLLKMVDCICEEEGLGAVKDQFRKVFSKPLDQKEKVFFVLVDRGEVCQVVGSRRQAKIVALESTIRGMSSHQRRLLLVELLRERDLYRNPQQPLRVILPFEKDFLKTITACYLH